MATTPVQLSMEDYLRTCYRPDMHYVEGELEERNLGEYEHSKLQSILSFLLQSHADEWNIDPLVEQRVQVSSDRVRICDVVALRADGPREAVTLTPPLLCIEILSPEDRLARAKVVLADYLAMGVEAVWLIDPLRQAAYTFDGAGLHEADVTNLVVSGTPIRIDLSGAFARLNAR